MFFLEKKILKNHYLYKRISRLTYNSYTMDDIEVLRAIIYKDHSLLKKRLFLEPEYSVEAEKRDIKNYLGL